VCLCEIWKRSYKIKPSYIMWYGRSQPVVFFFLAFNLFLYLYVCVRVRACVRLGFLL
jgi:hypothetical protein